MLQGQSLVSGDGVEEVNLGSKEDRGVAYTYCIAICKF